MNTPSVMLLILAPWLLWVFFVAVMRLKQVRDAGALTTAMKVFGYPVLVVGLFLDFLINVTLAVAMFKELPREWTVSGRLWRLSQTGSGWRRRWAVAIRVGLLDAIDPSGVHSG